ncbi:MAG: hypothetical protein ACYTEZ_13580 [Planctomycetota bacterium]|jgi:hypothetical protein
MKAVPVLVLTNALALGLVVLLFFQQSDLESQLNSGRTSAPRRTELVEDSAGMQDRIARLERLLAAQRRGDAPAGEAEGLARSAGDPAAGSSEPAGDLPPAAEAGPSGLADYDPREMEQFRRKVRRANQLNDQEDQVQRVVTRLDTLVGENKIAPLTPKQKERVAETILATRGQVPQIFRRLRESGAFGETSREERGQMIRAEFESLRVEAQKQLEEVVPAADAKTIMDDSMGDRGGFGGFGRGLPQRPRRSSGDPRPPGR